MSISYPELDECVYVVWVIYYVSYFFFFARKWLVQMGLQIRKVRESWLRSVEDMKETIITRKIREASPLEDVHVFTGGRVVNSTLLQNHREKKAIAFSSLCDICVLINQWKWGTSSSLATKEEEASSASSLEDMTSFVCRKTSRAMDEEWEWKTRCC